jgi:hypothetical protein
MRPATTDAPRRGRRGKPARLFLLSEGSEGMQKRPTRTVVEPDEQSEVNQPGLEPYRWWSRVHVCRRGPGSPGASAHPRSRRVRNAARTDTRTGCRGPSSDPLEHIGRVEDEPERDGPSCQEGFSEIQLDLDLNQMPPYAILSDGEKGRNFGGVSEHRRAEHAADADAG